MIPLLGQFNVLVVCLDADELPAETTGDDRRRTASHERVEHDAALRAAGADGRLDKRFGIDRKMVSGIALRRYAPHAPLVAAI